MLLQIALLWWIHSCLGHNFTVNSFAAGTHKHALGTSYGIFTGIASTLSVSRPKVTGDAQSISQIWIGSYNTGILEAGWHVYPRLYHGSLEPHLFIFWTADGYHNTGCYNLQCKGFVQTSKQVTLGGIVSVKEISLAISQDKKTKNWLLLVDNTHIGYWPASLMPLLQRGATQVAAGGEVATINTKEAVQMGNGNFPTPGKESAAAYHRNIKVLDVNYTVRDAELYTALVNTNRACYGIESNRSKWGTNFSFGGPGCS